MSNQTKEQLNKFFGLITSPQDIGLVVAESKGSMPDKKFWEEIDNNTLYQAIDEPKSVDSFIKKLIQAQKQEKRLILDIKIDPYPAVISLLKEISQFGKFNVKNAEGYTIERVDIRPGSIIVVAERDFIDNNITYPNFYNIFDSALSLK